MKKSLFLIFVMMVSLSWITTDNSGHVKGKITDKATKEAIPFANVSLEQKGKTVAGTTTDIDGNYFFGKIAPGLYNLNVSYVGYAPHKMARVRVDSATLTVANISLAQAVELKSFEVIEYKVPLIDADRTSSGGTITREDIQKMPGRSAEKKQLRSVYLSVKEEEINTESYDAIAHNQFESVASAPLSTFSIDVDVASYSNVRRFINQGMLPPKDAVRTEEMINYFYYDYPQPEEEKPFSITTELSACPWNKKNKLVHIGLQGRKIELEKLPPGNLVFLIDVSGSMDYENKLPLVKKSLRLLVNELREEDKISLVVYAGAAGVVLESTPGDKKDRILSAIEQLTAGGSTAGGAGINLAYKIAKENYLKNGNNRVILATDGDFNVGLSSDEDIVRLIEQKREEGIFLTVLGYGMGNLKDSKMEKLADKGNGNYAYIDNLQEAQRVLVNELGATLFTIAKDVKIQVDFNPAKVKAYRLIGYENRVLAAKDFNDDKKDAGELGAGHSVTALYEIVTSDMETGWPAVDKLKYQEAIVKPEALSSEEFLTVKLRYKEPKELTSKLITQTISRETSAIENTSDNFRFSAAVAQFGMILTDSEFKGTADYRSTLGLARNSKGKDMEGYRAEFTRLVELASRLESRSDKR